MRTARVSSVNCSAGTVQEILGPAPNRVAVCFGLPSSGQAFLGNSAADVGNGMGFYQVGNGMTPLILTQEDFGDLPGRSWFAWTQNICNIGIIEALEG